MTAVPLPRRPARRPRSLVFVAEHAFAIALSVMFLAPIGFLLLTSFMSNDQQLTADLWPRTWHPGSGSRAYARYVERVLQRMERATFLERLVGGGSIPGAGLDSEGAASVRGRWRSST